MLKVTIGGLRGYNGAACGIQFKDSVALVDPVSKNDRRLIRLKAIFQGTTTEEIPNAVRSVEHEGDVLITHSNEPDDRKKKRRTT